MLTMLMSILKTAKNLLRKILPQPEFELGISRLTETSVFRINNKEMFHNVMSFIHLKAKSI